VFEDLSQKLELVFKKLRGEGRITESNVTESLREVRRALLDADVNYKVVKQFVEDVQKRAVGQEVLSSITPGQLIVKIIFDEMVNLLGHSTAQMNESPLPPTIIMVAGLQGSGTTWPGTQPVSGSYSISPALTATTIFQLDCTGTGGPWYCDG